MKPLRSLAVVLLLAGLTMSGLALSSAGAMTPEEEAQLDALISSICALASSVQ
jgi:hypothetical protein